MDDRPHPAVPDLRGDIAKRTIKDMIGDKLTSLIASGILKVGEDLPSERELAKLLSVSRESVRSAVQSLAALGIVEVSQGARTRIARADALPSSAGQTGLSAINRYGLDEVHAARLFVELKLVGDAAEAMDAATFGFVERSLARQRDCFGDPVRFLICDKEFHVTIYRASGNQLLSDFVETLYGYMLDHRRVAMSKPGAIPRSYEDHRAIFDGLKNRDRDAVVAAFREHIFQIWKSTVATLEHRKPDAQGGEEPQTVRIGSAGRIT